MITLSPGFTTRPARPQDLPMLLKLSDLQRQADYGERTTTTLVELQESWASGGAGAFVVIVDRHDQPVAFAQPIISRNDSDLSLGIMMHVDPALRGQGLEAAIAALSEQHALEGAPAGAQVNTWALVTNQAAAEALEQMGYTRSIAFQTMKIRLGQPPPTPITPPGIVLRPFVPGRDEQVAYEADEEASLDKGYGQPKSYDQWARRLNLRSAVPPRGWFLAWDGAEVAGGIFCEYLEDSQEALIHHLGVRRRWRSQGVGRALLLQAFGSFYTEGVTRLTLDVDASSATGADRLYIGCGMHITGTRVGYKKVLRPA